ncbi:MAG: response regulator [Parachlamydia sp.]|nr:MAG: response regulator [Parachlamydia sp.]
MKSIVSTENTVNKKMTVLLIDDQEIVAEAISRMVMDEPDIVFHYCAESTEALKKADEVHPTVILQDLVMPGIDGLMLVRYFRANPSTSQVPMIVLSAKEDPKIKAEAFAFGANDYIVKLPDKIELLARLRYHSNNYIRLLERDEAYERLEESRNTLNAELAEAAQYVRSLLPEPLDDSVKTSWKFLPSIGLGGDAFGYYWLDDDHFVMYLLDVCGHGVGAALLSISIMNVLQYQSLATIDFQDPVAVLRSLNDTFQMEKHNNMFFSIWYGIYCKSKREIVYASGGHPPAILFTRDEKLELKTPGLVIGGMPGSEYQSSTCAIAPNSVLYIFSDGIYEIFKRNGKGLLHLQEFVDILQDAESQGESLDYILSKVRGLNNEENFIDDVSLIKLVFQ